MSDERINSIKTRDYGITPKLHYYGTKKRVEFNRSCLEQDKITHTHWRTVSIYIVFELTGSNSDDNDPTIRNLLSDTVTLTKNGDFVKYVYSGYGTGFDRRGSFSFFITGLGQNVIIFGVDTSSSTKIDEQKKDILILGKGLTQGLEHTLSA